MFISFKLKALAPFAAAVVLALALGVGILLTAPEAKATQAQTFASSKTVYLTFDDGPSANTAAVLDALERHGVKATFFITGHRPEDFDSISAAARAGHQIALHSYTHDFREIYASEEAFWADIERSQELIEAQTGERSTLLRFAGGSSNTIAKRSLMKTLVAQCAEMGYSYFDWNVDTRDAVGDTKSASYIAERALKGAVREEIPVILMHDGPMNTTAAEALDIIIPALKDRGYDFGTLGELGSTPVHHSLS